MKIQKSLIVSILALACILFAGAAQACTTTTAMGADTSSLTKFMGDASYTTYNGSLAGCWTLTPASTETSNTITLKDSNGNTLFTNWNWKTAHTSNLAGATYDITWHSSVAMTNTNQVHILTLTKDYTYKGTVLSAGTLIIGLEDTNSCLGGWDYNDLIFIAAKCAPTPLPAAVWLLGSGVMGLMGLRRARKGQAAA